MKIQIRFLYQLINWIAVLVFGLIIYEISTASLKNISWIVLMFYLSATFILLYRISKFLLTIKISDAQYLRLMLLSAFILRLYWIIAVDTKPFSDFALLLNTAKQFSDGDFSAFDIRYFHTFAYNIPFTIYEGIIYHLFHSVFVLKFINVLLSTSIVYFLYDILKQANKPDAGKIASFFATIFPPFIIYTSVLTNQTISIFFSLMAISLYFKSRSLFLVGLVLGFAQLFRPTAVIYFIAIILLILLANLNNTNNHLQTLKKLSVSLFKLITSYYLVLIIASQLIIYSKVNNTGLFYNPTPSYKFLVGFNHQTKGKYSVDDAALLNDVDHFEKIAKQKIKERTKDKSKLVALFFDKIKIFWGNNDASFFWALTKNISNKGKYYSLKHPTQLLYFVFWFFAFIAVVFNLRNKKVDEIISLPVIVVLAFWLVYLFIEIQTRYRYEIYPMILILSSIGVLYLYRYFNDTYAVINDD